MLVVEHSQTVLLVLQRIYLINLVIHVLLVHQDFIGNNPQVLLPSVHKTLNYQVNAQLASVVAQLVHQILNVLLAILIIMESKTVQAPILLHAQPALMVVPLVHPVQFVLHV